jgi:hypothetical protein
VISSRPSRADQEGARTSWTRISQASGSYMVRRSASPAIADSSPGVVPGAGRLAPPPPEADPDLRSP